MGEMVHRLANGSKGGSTPIENLNHHAANKRKAVRDTCCAKYLTLADYRSTFYRRRFQRCQSL